MWIAHAVTEVDFKCSVGLEIARPVQDTTALIDIDGGGFGTFIGERDGDALVACNRDLVVDRNGQCALVAITNGNAVVAFNALLAVEQPLFCAFILKQLILYLYRIVVTEGESYFFAGS